MNRRWDDTFLPDDGMAPPCRWCDEPAAEDDDGFVYVDCPQHLLEVSEPEEATG